MMQELQPFEAMEPSQIRVFPANKAMIWDCLEFVMSLFDAVTLLQIGETLEQGILMDVYSADPVSKGIGMERLKNSWIMCEFPEYQN